MRPVLSLVIPFFDVELYLGACLDSVANQSFGDIEVILVDDGSADASREVAEKFVKDDQRFQLVSQKNRGTGAARNTGMQHATGEYIAFVDSDDVVADDGYEQLVGSLRRTGSDIACGGVERFDSSISWPSSLHEGIFDEPQERTHITKRPDLLGDRTVWNKVYRRSFWDKHHLTYPEHALEDASIAVPAHVLATAVDLVTGPVYYWRKRDDGPPSTTQRIYDLHIIEGRMEQVRTVSGFLADHSTTLKDAYDLVALEHDVLILLSALRHVDDLHHEEILTFASEFCDSVAEEVFAELGKEDSECYRLLRSRRVEDLFRHLDARPQVEFL